MRRYQERDREARFGDNEQRLLGSHSIWTEWPPRVQAESARWHLLAHQGPT